ncbi:MAG: DUF2163 domain-containing protein [Pseudomonadota bacterium]
MRPVDALTAERFDRSVATLCTCWRLTRQDGEEIGFTDHDRDITFTGTVFKAQSGAEGSALEGSADLAPDNADMVGILNDTLLGKEAIDAGLYDDARLDIWKVDWAAPDARLLLKSGSIGNIERNDTGYTAEFRSLKHYLDQTAGRLYGRTCDAALGDARCQIDLDTPLYTGLATIIEGGVREFVVSGIDAFARDWFTQGFLTIQEGPLQNVIRAIRRHGVAGNIVTISLWEALPQDLTAGTVVKLTAGCDKRFETCQEKFNNILNFQGFPHIPGNDILTLYPNDGDQNDGGQR